MGRHSRVRSHSHVCFTHNNFFHAPFRRLLPLLPRSLSRFRRCSMILPAAPTDDSDSLPFPLTATLPPTAATPPFPVDLTASCSSASASASANCDRVNALRVDAGGKIADCGARREGSGGGSPSGERCDDEDFLEDGRTVALPELCVNVVTGG